jgi:hypothetical protein
MTIGSDTTIGLGRLGDSSQANVRHRYTEAISTYFLEHASVQ